MYTSKLVHVVQLWPNLMLLGHSVEFSRLYIRIRDFVSETFNGLSLSLTTVYTVTAGFFIFKLVFGRYCQCKESCCCRLLTTSAKCILYHSTCIAFYFRKTIFCCPQSSSRVVRSFNNAKFILTLQLFCIVSRHSRSWVTEIVRKRQTW